MLNLKKLQWQNTLHKFKLKTKDNHGSCNRGVDGHLKSYINGNQFKVKFGCILETWEIATFCSMRSHYNASSTVNPLHWCRGGRDWQHLQCQIVELWESSMVFGPEDKCIVSIRVTDGIKVFAYLCYNTWILDWAALLVCLVAGQKARAFGWWRGGESTFMASEAVSWSSLLTIMFSTSKINVSEMKYF